MSGSEPRKGIQLAHKKGFLSVPQGSWTSSYDPAGPGRGELLSPSTGEERSYVCL